MGQNCSGIMVIFDSIIKKRNLKKYKMKLKITIAIALIFFKMGTMQSQIGIGILHPDASAILDLSTAYKGLLIPRMPTPASILNPAKGLMYFNTTTNTLEINQGDANSINWIPLVGTRGSIGDTGSKGDEGPQGPPAIPIISDGFIGSTLVGGYNNVICGNYSIVVGGKDNKACGDYSIVGGGLNNSTPGLNSTIIGGTFNQATGAYSFIGGGELNTAEGLNSNISGGSTNKTSGVNSVIIGGKSNTTTINAENGVLNGGANNTINALNATISGGYNNTANGLGSIVSGGSHNTAASYGEWLGGVYSTNYSSSSLYSIPSSTEFKQRNRLFNVGNGTSNTNRNDAFTVLKNGLAFLPSVTNTLIYEGSIKAVVTKEYTEATYSKISTIAPDKSTSPGVPGEVRLTKDYFYSYIKENLWVRTLVDTTLW